MNSQELTEVVRVLRLAASNAHERGETEMAETILMRARRMEEMARPIGDRKEVSRDASADDHWVQRRINGTLYNFTVGPNTITVWRSLDSKVVHEFRRN